MDTENVIRQIPLLSIRAGPRDGDEWTKRLKEEYLTLIQVGCCILWLSYQSETNDFYSMSK